jgi:hypothetical protein
VLFIRNCPNSIIEEERNHPVPGGYKYGNLAHQFGGVSDETVRYGLDFCGTST